MKGDFDLLDYLKIGNKKEDKEVENILLDTIIEIAEQRIERLKKEYEEI